MQIILLYPNPNRDNNFELTISTALLLHKFNISVVVQEDIAAEFPDFILRMPLERGIDLCDLIISIGGDGTILRISAPASQKGKPVLGINAGKLGYLVELEKDELHMLEQIIRGNYMIDKRTMLETSVHRDGDPIFSARALNDAVLTCHSSSRVIALDFLVDNHHITTVNGDGLIAATPTGSTAYSMSAGGPLMAPNADGLLLTPICAHALFARSFVISGESVCTISISSPNRKALLTLDGVPALKILPGDQVEVRKSPIIFELIRLKNFNFYDILYNKLTNKG